MSYSDTLKVISRPQSDARSFLRGFAKTLAEPRLMLRWTMGVIPIPETQQGSESHPLCTLTSVFHRVVPDLAISASEAPSVP
jgi:hypothetical protein